MSEWSNRDYGDEDDFEGFLDDEDEFYLDEDEDDNINLGGVLVPKRPYPNGPSRGDALELDKQLVLCR
jgi:hypothetical protein